MGAPRPNRRGRARALLVALGLASTQLACFVSLDGLTGGSPSGDGHTDPPSSQAPPPPATSGTDSGTDAGSPAQQEDAETASPDSSTSTGTIPEDATAPEDSSVLGTGGGSALVLGSPTISSPAIGGDSGVAFSESCDEGAVLVGLNLVVDTDSPFALYQVQGVCSEVTTWPSGAVSFGPPVGLVDQGDNDGAAGSLVCPSGSVVVGWSATAEKFIHSIMLECEVLVASHNQTGFVMGLGGATLVGPFGGSDGDPVPSYQCPSPMVASSLSGTVGGTDFVDSLVMGCATPLWP